MNHTKILPRLAMTAVSALVGGASQAAMCMDITLTGTQRWAACFQWFSWGWDPRDVW